MPIGLLILIALSVVVSRHANQLGRRSGLWVVVLWLSCIVGGYLFAALAAAVSVFSSGDILTEAEVRSCIYLPTMAGMVFGAVVVVFAVNRPLSKPTGDSGPLETKEDSI